MGCSDTGRTRARNPISGGEHQGRPQDPGKVMRCAWLMNLRSKLVALHRLRGKASDLLLGLSLVARCQRLVMM
jgi:hypothetical protein